MVSGQLRTMIYADHDRVLLLDVSQL
jgi:hypothetical protein